MEGYKMLVKEIIEGLVNEKLTVEDVKEKINNSIINPLYKKGLVRMLFKDGVCANKSDTIMKLLDFENKNRVAIFEKVSEEQYIIDMVGHDLVSLENREEVLDCYKDIKLPVRGTIGSAGYDFICPVDISLNPGEELVVCTGIRCMMKENWVLKVYPRSSSGTKYRVQFNNTVPILDSDYYYTENEGHIMFKIINDGREGKVFELKKGEKLCQGIFVEYGITFDDDVTTYRTGGFGSTGK